MGSWIHDGFFEQFLLPTPSVAKHLMPRDIMSSEPRHWMVVGQLAMPVQCLGSDDLMSLGIKSSAFNRESRNPS